jgi:hypothetical protein
MSIAAKIGLVICTVEADARNVFAVSHQPSPRYPSSATGPTSAPTKCNFARVSFELRHRPARSPRC